MTQHHPEQHQGDARNPVALDEDNKPIPALGWLDEAVASAAPEPQSPAAGQPRETGLGPEHVQVNGNLVVDLVVGDKPSETAGEEAAAGRLLQATADVHAAMNELRRRLQSLEADPFSAESADALISLLIDERWQRAQRNWRVLNEAQSLPHRGAAETSRAQASRGDHDVLILDECWDLRSEIGTQRVSELLAEVTDLHRPGQAGRFIYGTQAEIPRLDAAAPRPPAPGSAAERLAQVLREARSPRSTNTAAAASPCPTGHRAICAAPRSGLDHRSSGGVPGALPDAGEQ